MISLVYNFYQDIGIENLDLKINSIGTEESRKEYKKSLYEYLSPHKEKLTSVSQKRLESNPLRILDTKVDFEIDIINGAPHILDFLSNEDKDRFEKILYYLDKLNIPYDICHNLVRGIDYYSHTVFEIQNSDLGSQNALCGGGRYDSLIKDLGGKESPAIGFAAGVERVILALKLDYKSIVENPKIYIISLGESALEYSLTISNSLRINNDFIIVNDTLKRSLKSQIKEANRLHAEYVIIIGENEINAKKAIIKNMGNWIPRENSIF